MITSGAYVLTSKGKLGQVIKPGIIDHEFKHYEPALVKLNNKEYEIWQENLTPVKYVAIKIMDEGIVTLTADKAFALIKLLLRNKVRVVIDVEDTKMINLQSGREKAMEQLQSMYP